MSRRSRRTAPRTRSAVALGCTLAALGGGLALHADRGAGDPATGPLTAQPVLGAPVGTLLGASPAETPGEAWGIDGGQLARYTPADGWQPQPAPVGADGQPIPQLGFASGALAGRATPNGGVAVAGTSGFAGDASQLLIVRDPGGTAHAAPTLTVGSASPPPPGDPNALLRTGESLYATNGAGDVLLAAVDEAGGHTGAYLVPAVSGTAVQTGVLHWDGSAWSREDICLGAQATPCQAPSSGFTVLALDATSDANAWLLARSGSTSDGIILLERDDSGAEPVWRPRSLAPSPFAQGTVQITQGTQTTSVRVQPRPDGQPLTVTSDGVWVDFQLTPQGTFTPLDGTLYFRPADGSVHSWCDVPAAIATLCDSPLGSALASGDGRSFAWWTGDGYGQRVITGLDQGAYLSLQGTTFARLPAAGGNAGSSGGAAFASPDEGWLGGPLVHLTHAPEPSRVQPWPVPFRRPLTAIAPQPGAPVGALTSQALAVGDDGQVVRYTPGAGWVPELLPTPTGGRATPRLRGVAWPAPDRAYAVGDHAEMWTWNADPGVWEPDPGRPPNLVLANLTGIAFDPANAQRGYVIGKQDVLLRYAGGAWQQDDLPAGLSPLANFSSIAFAGSEALVTYKVPRQFGGYDGGLIVNDGSGWSIDTSVVAALGGAAPERVAGLPDGGAVVASIDGQVAERDGPGSPWQPAPPGAGGYPSALAAFREDGQVRAVLSTDATGSTAGREYATDSAQVLDQPPAGQAPLLTDPYPLQSGGYLLRQTATGWRDEEHEAFPTPQQVSTSDADFPLRPDAVLALALDPSGTQGWAVGGETGAFTADNGDQLQTAGVMRYPADGAAPPSGTSTAPIATDAGAATFAVGGNAQCAGACADLGNTGIGPDAWLPAAVGHAAQIAGLRAFLYTGPGVADGLTTQARLGADAYARESDAYAARLAAAAGSLPVFTAVTPSDFDTSGSLATFAQAFGGFEAPLGAGAPGASVSAVSAFDHSDGAYSFDSHGPEGTVRVIVLGFAGPALGDAQRCWLAQQLAAASTAAAPAIVIGNRDVSASQGSPTAAADGDAIAATLVTGASPPGCTVATPSGASAYFFDYPKQNRTYAITSGGRSIPSFGSGTLGYIDLPNPAETDFVGASGFLLASVDVAQRDPATNVAPVTAKLIPNIGDLALDANDGTQLHRSKPALFDALARRPRAGMRCNGFPACGFSPNPYIPIPSTCVGARCASGMLPTYTFSSSNPDIADFVEQDPASANPRSVLLDANGNAIPDPTSGLLCSFNAGTTTVTVTTGGLSYSEQVTVEPGNVGRPCGTVPLRNPPAPAVLAPAAPAGEAPQAQPSGSTPLPPPPAPHAVAAAKPARHPPAPAHLPLAAAFAAVAPGLTQVIPAVPPPSPAAARPIPPSGTASVQVYQSAVAPERQRDEEVAIGLVHHMSAVGPVDDGPSVPAYLPALVLLAAFGGATLRGARRRQGLRRQLAYAESRERR